MPQKAEIMTRQRILIIDDIPANLRLMSELLKDQYRVSIALNGEEGLRLASSVYEKPSLILLDIMMPGMDGYEVCRRLKNDAATSKIPVLFVTARDERDDEAHGFALGAVDYITKPISPLVLCARVKTHLELYLYQKNLESRVESSIAELREGYIDTIHRLTLVSEYKDPETGEHIKRISYYTRELARQMGLGSTFCENIFHASPMHDIGKVGIPDAVLLKEGPLNTEEWLIMKSHTFLGAKILENARSPYLKMAIEIANYHHERFNGGGYPAGLSGEQIPLSARIMNLTDQYDALRSVRPYKSGFSHEKTCQILLEGDGRTSPEHFDPNVLKAFKKTADVFDEIFSTHLNNTEIVNELTRKHP